MLLQSRLAGHKRALVRSWLNPRPDFTLWGMWGVNDWPFGVIQSTIAPFIPLVSSALAPLEPFWIYWHTISQFSTYIGHLWRNAPDQLSLSLLPLKRSWVDLRGQVPIEGALRKQNTPFIGYNGSNKKLSEKGNRQCTQLSSSRLVENRHT